MTRAIDLEAFTRWMEALGIAPFPVTLAVAVSGGADSMALTLLTAEWTERRGVRLIAMTVDHGLRDDSAAEAEQVGVWLGAHGIAHRIVRWRPAHKPSSNIQAAAREARYHLLAEACAEEGIRHLLLAHHLDDQAETFLIRLQRGSGVDGLAAMHPVARFAPHGVSPLTLLRPLLNTPKTALVSYLEAQGQPWIDDPSNRSERHTRTRIRRLLPILADSGIGPETLAATSRRMARARNYLERQTEKAIADCLTLHDEGYITLHLPSFNALHPEIALRVLADALRLMNGTAYRPRLMELEALYHALPAARTLAGCRFIPQTGTRNRDALLIIRELAHIEAPKILEPNLPTLWDGRFEVILRSAAPARIEAWGKPPPKSLPVEKSSIPRRISPTLPALYLEKACLLPHIPLYDGTNDGILYEIRAFPRFLRTSYS